MNYLLIIIIFLLLVAGIVVAGIAVLQSKHIFRCQNCGKIFHPQWTQLIFEIHILNEHKIKCPYCKVKNYCVDEEKGR